MLPIKLITFDVTGTLLFFRPPIIDKYLETGLKFGVKIPREALERNFKQAWRDLNAEHPNFGRDTGLGWQTWWTRFVEKSFSDYVKRDEKSKIVQIKEEIIDYYTTKDGFTVRPGTEDLLKFLKTKFVKVGVISNYDPRLTSVLELVDLKRYLDFILTSYGFGFPKPDKRIFEEALRLGECTTGNEAVHIGDDVELDYLGAKEAGLRAVLIKADSGGLEKAKIKQEDVLEDFFKLKQHLQRLPELQ